MLGTVDNRAALHGYHPPVGFYLIIRANGARLHIEADDHLVALLPAALNVHVAVVADEQGHGNAVYDEAIAQPLVVGVLVEVAGHGLVAEPARDADFQVELAHTVLVDGQHGLAVPRVVGPLGQRQLLAPDAECRGVREKQVHVDILLFHGIDVAGQRGDEAADVRRTAGAAEPCLALVLAHRLQGVGIEETVALQRDTRNQAVVERALQHVVVLRLAVEQEQPVVDVDIADGGTRLAVGTHVGQFVVLAEGLAT